VESTRSQNNTVSWRRSASGGAEAAGGETDTEAGEAGVAVSPVQTRTRPTLGLLCHHEDDGAPAIGCLVPRLAPALRGRPPRTVTRCKRCVRGCPTPASTHVDLATWIRKEAR